ncbi:PP2C family protein-serine/threonine phosphatase [Candidatus Endoriftia persephone]|jgi:serine/threonine protein phosphatase PrpC|uniref:Serine/threonine protein phosphatase n=3 Tax=Gammaproteobacteria TaxID=1236 RepID=G2FGX3_9GAMM|nr:protein phosphatase 2C domain-containing protein [Candidatus Endoriftia persephone]EGV51983.1 serine/threonine protein phosphatase [endosymbiont of Riftia pachyptila (vent Ph05)]EGW53942.1 serine/threonine protein phosphatase [endosymbiont of Tevnia jerichonana (vent Tica)]USF87371.1 protein phosphatase 2C domain-containing protein [Candidatus Endoriftia persephone]
MKYHSGQCTLIGNRSLNQDRCLIMESPDSVLLALADGMGGHPRGEMAAQVLMNTCRKSFLTSRKPISSPRVFLSGLMDMAHRSILEFGRDQQPPIEPRTTATLCLIQDGNAYWAHAGDSRIYLLREGVIAHRTADHSYVEQLRQQGVISAAQAATHRYRNYVTRCLGGISNRPVAEFSGPFKLQRDDVLMLCSDGFWGALQERVMAQQLSDISQPLSQLIEMLSNRAAANSQPESDNVTAIGLRWGTAPVNLKPADFSMALGDNTPMPDTPELPSDKALEEAINSLRGAVIEATHKSKL